MIPYLQYALENWPSILLIFNCLAGFVLAIIERKQAEEKFWMMGIEFTVLVESIWFITMICFAFPLFLYIKIFKSKNNV